MAYEVITARWTSANQSGRMPGTWGDAGEAAKAAADFMVKYPQVTVIDLYHRTGGHVRTITRKVT